MKFKDLKVKDHPGIGASFSKQARHDFPNGYGVSVITGPGAYCGNDGDSFEVAIFKDGDLCYTTPLTDDVLSYQTSEDIDSILETISKYKKGEY